MYRTGEQERMTLVTFGEAMLRLSPPRGERLETMRQLDVRAAGAESNVAVAASNLGVDAVWLSKLPDSPLGRWLVRELRGHGVRTGVAWSESGRASTCYEERGGPPRGSTTQYDRTDAAVNTAVPDELPLGAVRETDWFHTTGLTPALSETLARTTATLFEAAAVSGGTTSLELRYQQQDRWSPDEARSTLEALFPHVDVLFVSERDARVVLDIEGEPLQVAHRIATEHDFETVVLTRSPGRAVAVHADEVFEQSPYETETVDPNGSRDAFVGGFVARRLQGGHVGESLAYGAATAALKRTLAGDFAVVTQREVEAVVDDR
jgi:2-dehydro-3-deoxygluconokinase